MKNSALKELINEEVNEENEENNKIIDIYQIINESNLISLLKFDKSLVENLTENIGKFQEYYIEILNIFLTTGKKDVNPITKFEITLFRQIAELNIRLQEYYQSEGNEIPKWIKYFEKIIFNYKDNNVEDILPIEAANILLDLNLSFSIAQNDNVYAKIKDNFSSAEIDNQIIEIKPINEIIKNMPVKNNCYELLLAKFYLLSNQQSYMSRNMEILLKIFTFDKNRFFDVIDNTFENKENLNENIKLFSHFWKSVNDYYPSENFFKKETIFKMLDFLEDKNPRLRHLSKTWLNQANQSFRKIIDPILNELINEEIIFEIKKEEKDEPTEFTKQFDTSKILEAITKLKDIIINSQIMPFLKEDLNGDIYSKIKFNVYNKCKMSYLQTLICTILHFLRTKANKDLDKDFINDVLSLNAASTEFLEFLLKNINDYDFLIKNIKLINNTILEILMKGLEEKNEVMAVQLLDVLKTLYFNYPPDIIKIPENKEKYINLLMNESLENIIKEGMNFDHFYIREHFISFTKQLVETFFISISIEDKDKLKKFYQSCNRFIEPLVNLLSKKVVFENKIKIDTESFSHYDSKHNNIIYKNYCEEYKEYKIYDESEVLSILKGINDIISKCSSNQIQEKNRGMGTNEGIKLFAIPIPFIKKKSIIKTDFQGNWHEHKKQLANDIKTDNAFVSFMTNIFDFVDENPNKEIKDMSTNLYQNQTLNLLKSFLSIWINQSDKYEKFDYCLNPNGILVAIKNDGFKNNFDNQISIAKESIKTNTIKSEIINITTQLFVTDSIKFIGNIMNLWLQNDKTSEIKEEKDKQYKLSIIELLFAMNIPIDVILFCVGIYLQKTFNSNRKKYIKSKPDKCFITPLDVSITEAKIFHFIYSYISLYPVRYSLNKENEYDKFEIWKEMINVIQNSLNETKIINSICWLYEILQITAQKFSPNNIDNKDIKNGIENIFNGLSNKLMEAIFTQKTDSKYINDSKLTIPFLPHVYSNMVKEVYKDIDLYHKNVEGNKNTNSDFNRKTIKSKISSEIIDKKLNLLNNKNSLDIRSKAISQSLVIINKIEPPKPPKQEETESSIIDFYNQLIKVPKTNDEYDNSGNSLNKKEFINKSKLNNIYSMFAFITLKENFHSLIKIFFEDNIKNVSKYYNDLINKLLLLIKKVRNDNIFNILAHNFLSSLITKSPKNVCICGKDSIIEYIKSPKFFKSTIGELHDWKNIIQLFSENYNDILQDLINDLNDKNIFVKKTEEDKCQILRRVSFVIFSCKKDFFSKNFALIKSKAKELLSDFSKNKVLEREIFLLLRMLFLRFSHDAVMQMIRDLWPLIFTELVTNINNYINKSQEFTTVLEPFKFIELLSLVNIDEFSLYQWIFLFDTFDVKECNARIVTSLCKKLVIDMENIFKPLTLKIMKDNLSDLNENMLEGKNKAKSELIIDAETDEEFRKQLYELFYSIGDMNSFKVEANYNKIEENIEKDFIDKTKENNENKKENNK